MPVTINGSNTPTAGGVVYGDGGQYATTSAGTSGQVLTSAGASAPTWTTLVVPGATAQYSVVGPTPNENTITAFNPSDIATGRYTSAPLGTYSGNSIRASGNPQWSSYYQKWYMLMASEVSGAGQALYFSNDGLSWNSVIASLDSAVGYTADQYNGDSRQSLFAIDDSNGRMFIANTGGGTSIRYAYSNITAGAALNSGWTSTTILSGGTYDIFSLRYCKMSTTAASGLVLRCSSGNNALIYTCSAGSTTFTSRLNVATVSTRPASGIYYEENGKIFSPVTGGNPMIYNTSGNITTGWTQGSTVSPEPSTGRTHCVGNGYFVYISGTELYYSTTGSGASWTNSGLSAATQLRLVFYTGTNFVAIASGTNYYTYVSAGNTPTSFSLLGTGPTPQKSMVITNLTGQRLTAT